MAGPAVSPVLCPKCPKHRGLREAREAIGPHSAVGVTPERLTGFF